VFGLVFPYQAMRLAWETSPKLLILCREGRKSLTQSILMNHGELKCLRKEPQWRLGTSYCGIQPSGEPSNISVLKDDQSHSRHPQHDGIQPVVGSVVTEMDLTKWAYLWSPYVIGRPYIFSYCRLLWPPYVIGGPLYFRPVISIFYLSIYLFSPNLSGRRLDVYHTLTHGVAPVRI